MSFFVGPNCTSPDPVDHATSDLNLNSTNFPYKTAINFTCNEGTLFDDGNRSRVMTCGDNATWGPSIGICEEIGTYDGL